MEDPDRGDRPSENRAQNAERSGTAKGPSAASPSGTPAEIRSVDGTVSNSDRTGRGSVDGRPEPSPAENGAEKHAQNRGDAGAAADGAEPQKSKRNRRRRRKKSQQQRALQGRPMKQADNTDEVQAARASDQNSVGNPGRNTNGQTNQRIPDRGTQQHKSNRNGNSRFQKNRAAQNSGRHGHGPLYAALDLGTNNCRLLVAQPTRPGQFRVVDAFSRIVRLGEGLVSSGRLSDAAMDRAVEALRICSGKIRNKKIQKWRLIATEACRSADNGTVFLNRVKDETGLDLEIVDRQTEARLAVSGCSSLVDRQTQSVVLFDIGGGSSEIAVIDLAEGRSNRLSNHIAAWTSLPVGVVTLSERHGGKEVTPEIFEAMVSEVETMLKGFECPDILQGCDPSTFHLLGTSGTVTTLAGVHLNLPRYDRRQVDGLWLSADDVDLMMNKILSWDFAERSANPCIGADRADLVLAGCAILEAIRRRWPAERMRVADRGLREGLLTEMMAADGVWRRHKRGRGRAPFQQHNQGKRS